MKTSLILLTLVGFAACSTPWQVNQQYDYAFSANTLTGYPHGQDQYVGIVTKGKLTLQPESESVVRGKLWQVRHAHFHDELKDGLNSPIPEEALSFNDQPSGESHFSINYKNGVIRSVDVDPALSNDDVNQLKAVLSQLQVDTTGENAIKCRHNQLPEEGKEANNALYKTMEATLVGECETLYEMSAVPAYMEAEPSEQWGPQVEMNLEENLYRYVKTVNFSNCDVRRSFHYGISGASDMKPNSNQMGDFLSKSAVSRVLVAGQHDGFTIKAADTINRVAVSALLHDNEQAEVVSRIGIVLESIEASQTPLPSKGDNWVHVGSLVYRYDIPSDKQNQPRTSAKSALAGNSPSSSSSSSSSSSEEQSHKQRGRRSADDAANQVNKHTAAALSSSSSSSESSEEYNSPQYSAKHPHHYQPHPEMEEAPEQPMHPFTVGNKGSSIQHLPGFDCAAEAQKLAQEIAADLQAQDEIPSRNTLEKYTILSDLIETASHQQIQQILDAAHRDQNQPKAQWGQQLAYEVLLDATAQAGTNPAALWFVNAVADGRVAGSDAASYLETVFENVVTPTEPLIRAIFEKIIKNAQISKQNDQYPKILLTFTDLVRRAYSDKDSAANYFPVQAFGSFEKGLRQIVEKEIIPHLGQALKQSISEKDQQRTQLHIRALGNVADPQIVEVFEEYLENEQSATPFERLSIVAAFDKLVETYPKFAQKILYKIYANVADRPDIRSMAVARLMLADPPAAMLQKMAMSTYNEPSNAVRSTIKAAIDSAAGLTSSANANLAANAKAAQSFLNPHTYGLQNSQTTLQDHVSEILNLDEEYQMTHIIGPDHTFPKVLSYSSCRSHGGVDFDAVDMQAMVSSVQDVWDALLEDRKGRGSWSIGNLMSKFALNKIIKQLGINHANPSQEEGITGQLLLKLAGRTNFFSFDEESLKSAPKELASLAKDLMSGRQLQYNKMYDHDEVVLAFPLATGYSFYYAYKTPLLMQVVGDVKVTTMPRLSNAKNWANVLDTQGISASCNLNLTVSSAHIGKAGFVTPFESQHYVAGQIQKMQVHLPLSASLNVDIKNTAVSGKIAPAAKSQDKIELAHYSSWPFTARQSALSMRPVEEAKEVKLVSTRPSVAEEEVIGEDSIGMGLRYQMEHQFSQSAINTVEEQLQKEGVKQYVSLPMNAIATLQRLVNQQNPASPAEFLPYAFEPLSQSSQTGNVILSLLTAPLYQDLESTGVVKLRAALSLATMAFSDATTYQEDNSANGPWPQPEVAQCKFSLQFDPQRSANQGLKFGVQFDQEEDINASSAGKWPSKPLGEAGEDKLAVVSDITPNSKSRREEMMANAGRDMKQAAGGLIDSAIEFEGAKPAKFVFSIAQAVNAVEDKARSLVFGSAQFAKKAPSQQVYASYVQNFPNTPALNYEKALQHNAKSNAKLTVLFGEAGKLPNTKINVKADFQQSSEYSQQVSQTPDAQACMRQMQKEGNNQMPACLNATYNANLLDEIRIVADAPQLTPELSNWAESALSVLNHWGYYNAKHDPSQAGTPGRTEAQVNIDPLEHTLNITLQLPSGQQNFSGLVIPRAARQLLSLHPGMSLDERTMRAYTRNGEVCVIDRSKILTFDNAEVENQKLGNCWYAAVQHNNSNNAAEEISIMVRQSGSNQKEVLIIAPGQVIQLSPSDKAKAPAKVTVNGKEQKVSDKDTIEVRSKDPEGGLLAKRILIVRIYAISDGDLKVEMPEAQMKMYYDGERVRVHAHPDLRSEVYGLCGNYNGEEIDDVATPGGKIFQNQDHFASAWIMPEDACDADVKQRRQNALAAPSYPVQFKAGNVVSDFENGKERQAKGQEGKKWKWESDSSSSSSESDEDGAKATQPKGSHPTSKSSCEVVKRVQFVTEGKQTCFTKTAVNTCPRGCEQADVTEIEVPAHCRNKGDSVASMFVQMILRGASIDIGSKQANKTVRVPVPGKCVPQQ